MMRCHTMVSMLSLEYANMMVKCSNNYLIYFISEILAVGLIWCITFKSC